MDAEGQRLHRAHGQKVPQAFRVDIHRKIKLEQVKLKLRSSGNGGSGAHMRGDTEGDGLGRNFPITSAPQAQLLP